MKTAAKTLILAFFAIALLACQSTNQESRADRDLREVAQAMDKQQLNFAGPARNVPVFRIDNWTPINDRNLIIHAGSRTHYLIVLSYSCEDLRSSTSIGFDSPNGMISSGDALIVRSFSEILDRCHISEVVRLVDREEVNDDN